MVIQRWQSVLLLIAAVCMVVFCFVPFASVSDSPQAVESVTLITPSRFIVFFVLNLTIAALLFIAIFLFKNMRRQRTVTLLSMLLIVVSAVTGAFIAYGSEAGGQLGCGMILLALALVATLWAYRRIGADQRLLRAADRLR